MIFARLFGRNVKRNAPEGRVGSTFGEGKVLKDRPIYYRVSSCTMLLYGSSHAGGRWESCYLLLEWSATPSAWPINICRYAPPPPPPWGEGARLHIAGSRHLDFTPLYRDDKIQDVGGGKIIIFTTPPRIRTPFYFPPGRSRPHPSYHGYVIIYNVVLMNV